VAPFGILPSIIEEVACQRIQVAVRVRPLHDTEREDHCAVRCDSKRNEIVFGQQNKTMVFDWVAPPDTTQEEVFLRVGMPLANKCMEGYNGTAFAYGQTGSGKTFTMQGPCMFDAEFAVRGLIPRTLDYLFALIHKEKKMRPNTRITCQCSFYEIYNEDIFDLMQPTGSPPLTTRESSDKGPFVAGLLQHEIDNFDSAHAVLLEGTGRRRVGSTQMNRESSRSHSVFTLYLSQSINDDGFVTHKSCKLNFVDLAGSERQSRSAAEGSQLKEASSINKSLSTLGPVIRGLVEQSNGTNTHIPYRESKLTYLLRESFGGNSMTWMIANISPSRTSFGETLSTLQFAACAAQVVTRATVNEDIAGGVEELKHQIRSLQYRLDESEARVEALKDAQKRRRSVRLSVQPCIGGSPLAARTPTPHSHSTSVITASSSVTDQQVRSMISENSRMQRELQLARSHVHTLQAACKKKDEVCQQFRFIAQLSHAENTALRDTLDKVDQDYKDWLADNSGRLIRLQHTVAYLTTDLTKTEHDNASLRDTLKKWQTLATASSSLPAHSSPNRLSKLSPACHVSVCESDQHHQHNGNEQQQLLHHYQQQLQQLRELVDEREGTIRELSDKVLSLEAEVQCQDMAVQQATHKLGLAQHAQHTHDHEAHAHAMQRELDVARHEWDRQRVRAEDADKRVNEAQAHVQQLTSSLYDTRMALERTSHDCTVHAEEAESRDMECSTLRSRVSELEAMLDHVTQDLQRQRTLNERLEQAMAESSKEHKESSALKAELNNMQVTSLTHTHTHMYVHTHIHSLTHIPISSPNHFVLYVCMHVFMPLEASFPLSCSLSGHVGVSLYIIYDLSGHACDGSK